MIPNGPGNLDRDKDVPSPFQICGPGVLRLLASGDWDLETPTEGRVSSPGAPTLLKLVSGFG